MEAIKKQFILPVQPQVAPRLPVVYPWENTTLYNLCVQLYELAHKTGYEGTLEEFKAHFGEYLNSDGSLIHFDEYTGEYTVTPLPTVEQILRTSNKLLVRDIVIDPIPYAEVSNDAGGTTVIIG